MADANSSTLGRMLTALGALWMAWAVIAGFVELGSGAENLGLPFLPGLLFFFVGRILTRAARRRSAPDEVPSRPERHTVEHRPREEPRGVPTPRSAPRPEPEIRLNPHDESADETPPELAGLEDAILEVPAPKSSEEMLAEARRRFGPRPGDRRKDRSG